MTWSIVRIEAAPIEQATLECLAGLEPVKVILKNSETGLTEVQVLCAAMQSATPCTGDGLLHLLSTPYPDNDFGCS